MIARARIRLPYQVPLAQSAIGRPQNMHWRGYKVVIYPLSQAEETDPTRDYLSRPAAVDEASRLTKERPIELPVAGVTLNNQVIVLCNVLTIDFLDVTYDRQIDQLPRSESIATNFSAGVPTAVELFDLANALLRSLRAKSGLSMIREVQATRETWLIEYLDDSGAALLPEEGKLRKRQSYMGSLPWGAVFEPTMQSALADLGAPAATPWDDLMLQAVDALPSTGSAVVLAFAALELLINTVISENLPSTARARERKSILTNKRSSPLFRADTTLTSLVGQSFRSQADAWQAAEQLAGLRNQYLHYGIEPNPAGGPAWFEVGQLLGKASEGMLWLEGFLPAQLRRDRAIEAVNVKYDLPGPGSSVFGAAGDLVLYLPNDPKPKFVSSPRKAP